MSDAPKLKLFPPPPRGSAPPPPEDPEVVFARRAACRPADMEAELALWTPAARGDWNRLAWRNRTERKMEPELAARKAFEFFWDTRPADQLRDIEKVRAARCAGAPATIPFRRPPDHSAGPYRIRSAAGLQNLGGRRGA